MKAHRLGTNESGSAVWTNHFIFIKMRHNRKVGSYRTVLMRNELKNKLWSPILSLFGISPDLNQEQFPPAQPRWQHRWPTKHQKITENKKDDLFCICYCFARVCSSVSTMTMFLAAANNCTSEMTLWNIIGLLTSFKELTIRCVLPVSQ